jgi:hypothetical protein
LYLIDVRWQNISGSSVRKIIEFKDHFYSNQRRHLILDS